MPVIRKFGEPEPEDLVYEYNYLGLGGTSKTRLNELMHVGWKVHTFTSQGIWIFREVPQEENERATPDTEITQEEQLLRTARSNIERIRSVVREWDSGEISGLTGIQKVKDIVNWLPF